MITFLSITVLLAGGAIYARLLSDQADHSLEAYQLTPEQQVRVRATIAVERVSCFHCGFNEMAYVDYNGYYCACARGQGRDNV